MAGGARAEPTASQWSDWRWQLRNMIDGSAEIAARIRLTDEERAGLAAAGELFRVGITPYYFSLIDPEHPSCPVRMQMIPRAAELHTTAAEYEDPLGEDAAMPVPGLVHRYPDRVLFLVVNRCAVYCRHCNRRRMVCGDEGAITDADLQGALGYIRANRQIKDVLLSGGDPLCLSTGKLDRILGELRRIPHLDIIRLGTRVPVCLPMRIDAELCAMLKKHHPLYVNTHFNHPKELTPEARRGLEMLADAGIPLGNQCVLLRGVNSSARVIRALVRELLKVRVRPYYLFQGDPVTGTDHLRTPVAKGIEIVQQLRGWVSGMAIPHLVIDAPGGGGKLPILPSYVLGEEGGRYTVRNYRGQTFEYIDPIETDCTVPYDDVWFGSQGEE